ncbi:MAG: hypothetical protein ABI778_10575 [Ignavibacteriota bacterium]
MKYLYYGLLCLMFTGCDKFAMFAGCAGCDGCESFAGCSPEQIDAFNAEAFLPDHPFAVESTIHGGDILNDHASTNGSEVRDRYGDRTDYSLDFGFKYFLDPSNAIRAGATFSTFTDGRDSGATKSSAIGPFIGYEHHFNSSPRISPYLGAAVGYTSWSNTMSYQTGGSANDGIPKTQATQDPTNDNTLLQVQAMAGFDWYFLNGLAIGAEYSFGFSSYGTSQTDATGKKTDKPTQTSLGILGGGNVHLLVHF